MADKKESKPGSKTGETLLGVLGSLGSIAGPLLTGQNIDFGLPFKLGAAHFKTERMNDDLMKVLQSNPYTEGIVEDVQGVMDSGGLPGMMNQEGPLEAPGVPSAAQQLSGGLNLPQSDISPVIPGVTPINQQEVSSEARLPEQPQHEVMSDKDYYQSPEFMQKLAEFRPDLMEKAIPSIVGRKESDPITEILRNLTLKNYQTPSQKKEAKAEEIRLRNKLVTERQQTAKVEDARAKREIFGVTERKDLINAKEAVRATSYMLDQVNQGVTQNPFIALMSKSAATARAGEMMGFYTNEQIQQSRDVKEMVMKAVKQQSGVQYGFRELQWIKSTKPSEWDSPEMFKRGVQMIHNKSQWNYIGRIIDKAERSGNVEVALREGITAEQMKAWSILNKQLEYRATEKSSVSIFSDPANKRILDTLKMTMVSPEDK